MKYEISWMERKVSKNGKEYIKATVKDEQGKTDDVSIWPDFSYYADLKPSSVVEGNILTKGQYKNLVSGSRSLNPNYKSAQIEQAQERKAEYIEKAQDRKDHSITYFNSLNAAISLVKDLNLDDDGRKVKIAYWRDWFIREYENYKDQPF